MRKIEKNNNLIIALAVGAFFLFLAEIFQATKLTMTTAIFVKQNFEKLLESAGAPLTAALLLLLIAYFGLLVYFIRTRRSYAERIRELESFGVIAINERAEQGIKISLESPKTSFFWHGYSSVNVVTQVVYEKIIRQKIVSGITYHFSLLDPTSTFGCLLHSKHEQNNDDQGRGYIIRALSAIREMENDNAGISHSHFYLPPIYRIINIDNQTLHVGMYPSGNCGIDSKELVIRRSEISPLYDFFMHFAQRYSDIGEYLRVRDVAFSAILKSFISKDEMPYIIDGLVIPAADSDRMRIVRAELTDILNRSDGVQLRGTFKKKKEGRTEMESEHILNQTLAATIETYRMAIRSISQALSNAPSFSILDVGFARAELGLDPKTEILAVKIPAKSKGTRRRAYSGWLAHAAFESIKGALSPPAKTEVGTIENSQICKLTQFSFSSDVAQVLAWGTDARSVLNAVIAAAKTFDPTKFDEDGYPV